MPLADIPVPVPWKVITLSRLSEKDGVVRQQSVESLVAAKVRAEEKPRPTIVWLCAPEDLPRHRRVEIDFLDRKWIGMLFARWRCLKIAQASVLDPTLHEAHGRGTRFLVFDPRGKLIGDHEPTVRDPSTRLWRFTRKMYGILYDMSADRYVELKARIHRRREFIVDRRKGLAIRIERALAADNLASVARWKAEIKRVDERESQIDRDDAALERDARLKDPYRAKKATPPISDRGK